MDNIDKAKQKYKVDSDTVIISIDTKDKVKLEEYSIERLYYEKNSSNKTCEKEKYYNMENFDYEKEL